MVTISSVKARNIMQTEVVALAPSTPIQSAIQTFEELHISGAPVVDEGGRILGMLSAVDIAKAEHIQDDSIRTESGEFEMLGAEEDDDEGDPRSFDEAIFSLNDFSPPTTGRTRVSDWMSRGIVAVGPDCGLRTICRLMVKEHIHRVPVVANGKLAGIISTLDIVRCIAGEPAPRATEPGAAHTVDERPGRARRVGNAGAPVASIARLRNGSRRPKQRRG